MFLESVHYYLLSPYPPSPFLNGIDVPEEQQHLAAAALLPVREEQVVPGDAQGASARRVQRLPEHNILHIGRLDVVRKLHQQTPHPTTPTRPPPVTDQTTELVTVQKRLQITRSPLFLSLCERNESKASVRPAGWVTVCTAIRSLKIDSCCSEHSQILVQATPSSSSPSASAAAALSNEKCAA